MMRPGPWSRRFVLGLLLCDILFNFTAGLYWLAHAHELPRLASSSAIARLYRDFAHVDHGYFDQVGQAELGLEALRATVVQMLNLSLLAALLRGWAARVPLQIAVGAIVAYSVLFDWTCAAVGGFPNMDEGTAASFAIFLGAGAVPLFGHLYFVLDGWRTARLAMHAHRPPPAGMAAPLLRRAAMAARPMAAREAAE